MGTEHSSLALHSSPFIILFQYGPDETNYKALHVLYISWYTRDITVSCKYLPPIDAYPGTEIKNVCGMRAVALNREHRLIIITAPLKAVLQHFIDSFLQIRSWVV